MSTDEKPGREVALATIRRGSCDGVHPHLRASLQLVGRTHEKIMAVAYLLVTITRGSGVYEVRPRSDANFVLATLPGSVTEEQMRRFLNRIAELLGLDLTISVVDDPGLFEEELLEAFLLPSDTPVYPFRYPLFWGTYNPGQQPWW